VPNSEVIIQEKLVNVDRLIPSRHDGFTVHVRQLRSEKSPGPPKALRSNKRRQSEKQLVCFTQLESQGLRLKGLLRTCIARNREEVGMRGTTPECSSGSIHSKAYQDTTSTF